MTYIDIIDLAVSGFGLGIVSGVIYGAAANFIRSLGHN